MGGGQEGRKTCDAGSGDRGMRRSCSPHLAPRRYPQACPLPSPSVLFTASPDLFLLSPLPRLTGTALERSVCVQTQMMPEL